MKEVLPSNPHYPLTIVRFSFVRFGEGAAEVADDVLATAGHAVCICWNVFRIEKAINPASRTAIVKNAIGK